MPCLALAPLAAAAAALGPWTYADFVADPSPTTIPTPAPAAASRPSRPIPPPAAPVESTAPAASRPVSPIRYRLADTTGQVWEHADPAWLQTFVAGRNAQSYRPLVVRPAYSGGRCR